MKDKVIFVDIYGDQVSFKATTEYIDFEMISKDKNTDYYFSRKDVRKLVDFLLDWLDDDYELV